MENVLCLAASTACTENKLLRMARAARDLPYARRRYAVLGLLHERLRLRHSVVAPPDPGEPDEAALFGLAYNDTQGADYWRSWLDAPAQARTLAAVCTAHRARDRQHYGHLLQEALAAFSDIRDGESGRDAVERVHNDINRRHVLPGGLVRHIGGTLPIADEAPTARGKPGRPGNMALIRAEYERREATGMPLSSNAEEAWALRQWLRHKHPDLRAPAIKTISNQLARWRRGGR